MADAFRYLVRSPDGRAVFGFANLEGAATAVLACGDGDTGRFGRDRDFIAGNKKGHVAIVHGFLDKGAEVNAARPAGGPPCKWQARADAPI